MYTPGFIDESSLAALARSMKVELERLAMQFAQPQEYSALKTLYAQPGRIFEGMIVKADGSTWNPGLGPGVYVRQGNAWVADAAQTGWRDMLGSPTVRGSGANDPSWSVWRNGIKQYKFSQAATNELTFVYHFDHDYKPNSDVHFHVHWSQDTIDTGGTAGAPGAVKWYAEATYAKGHNQAAFPVTITTSLTATASGAATHQHLITEIQLSASSPSATQLDSALLETDGLLIVRLYRNPADAADTLNQGPFVHYADLHYQADHFATLNKAPPFI